MQKRPRKIPTPQSLANIALHYLGRYAASESSLRRVLNNRMRRVAMDNAAFAADYELQTKLRSAIEIIIEGHKRSGVINDAVFAESKIVSLRRQGRSRAAIKQKLALKGIKSSLVDDALAQSDESLEPAEAELRAATALARKRKWGPFRSKPADDDRKRKEYGGLARAGFPSNIVRQVLQLDYDAAEDLLKNR